MFVATNVCLPRQNFCRNKFTFVATKDVFCHDKHVFVATKLLSRQAYVSRDKHVFVATKMILVVAPANDTSPFLLW